MQSTLAVQNTLQFFSFVFYLTAIPSSHPNPNSKRNYLVRFNIHVEHSSHRHCKQLIFLLNKTKRPQPGSHYLLNRFGLFTSFVQYYDLVFVRYQHSQGLQCEGLGSLCRSTYIAIHWHCLHSLIAFLRFQLIGIPSFVFRA